MSTDPPVDNFKDFLSTHYPAKKWFYLSMVCGTIVGLIWAWEYLLSAQYMRVLGFLILGPVFLYGIHLVSFMVFYILLFYLSKRSLKHNEEP